MWLWVALCFHVAGRASTAALNITGEWRKYENFPSRLSPPVLRCSSLIFPGARRAMAVAAQEDKDKLAKQLEQMKDALKQGAADAKEAREKLQQQIEKKLEEGNLAEAAKLQQQLDEMNQNAEQMQQMMEKLADKLGQAAQAMKEGGDPKQAGEKLDQLAQDLDQLQEQLDQIENLNEILDQLADAKNAMKCQNCGGAGCKDCEGNGDAEGKGGKGEGKGKGKGKGDFAKGAGQGEGLRDEEETDKSFYDTRVGADPKAGESVRVGDAGGNNVAGKSREAVKEAVQAALAKVLMADDTYYDTLRDKFEGKRRFVGEALTDLGFKIYESGSAFYLWARIPEEFDDALKFNEMLMEKAGVGATPGSAFADTDDWDAYMRICIAREDEILEGAMGKIKSVLG
ncbi:MAG: aminotransferase class I/II-fold pyridoxal phosphate-dependent enzyme [Blastocatellia bacterium]|nr:aminotransferase class I/II-fold pyridoxal phosphate-dependent enzyme [Blastocatellia bacterium]